jgi:GLPGLI family protein
MDTCLLKVTYDVAFVNDTIQREKRKRDIEILEIGSKVCRCYSYLLFQGDSLSTAMKRRGGKAFPNFKKYVIPEEIFTYTDRKQMETVCRVPMALPCYTFFESVPEIKWNLWDDNKSILGYNCKKATCIFRGRNYIAWYSSEIPLRCGPYKFSGLPGLILSISDSNDEYCWKCIGIVKGNNKIIIRKYTSDTGGAVMASRDQVRKTLQRFYEDPARYLILSRRIGKFYYGGKEYPLAPHDFPPEPYNPIEKE